MFHVGRQNPAESALKEQDTDVTIVTCAACADWEEVLSFCCNRNARVAVGIQVEGGIDVASASRAQIGCFSQRLYPERSTDNVAGKNTNTVFRVGEPMTLRELILACVGEGRIMRVEGGLDMRVIPLSLPLSPSGDHVALIRHTHHTLRQVSYVFVHPEHDLSTVALVECAIAKRGQIICDISTVRFPNDRPPVEMMDYNVAGIMGYLGPRRYEEVWTLLRYLRRNVLSLHHEHVNGKRSLHEVAAALRQKYDAKHVSFYNKRDITATVNGVQKTMRHYTVKLKPKDGYWVATAEIKLFAGLDAVLLNVHTPDGQVRRVIAWQEGDENHPAGGKRHKTWGEATTKTFRVYFDHVNGKYRLRASNPESLSVQFVGLD